MQHTPQKAQEDAEFTIFRVPEMHFYADQVATKKASAGSPQGSDR